MGKYEIMGKYEFPTRPPTIINCMQGVCCTQNVHWNFLRKGLWARFSEELRCLKVICWVLSKWLYFKRTQVSVLIYEEVTAFSKVPSTQRLPLLLMTLPSYGIVEE